MYNNDKERELRRLNFEDYIWIIYICVSVLNLYGNNYIKEYLRNDNRGLRNRADIIFEVTSIMVFFIYIYFFIRNYRGYQRASPEEKDAHLIRVLGSGFLIAGSICLIYFQTRQTFGTTPSAK